MDAFAAEFCFLFGCEGLISSTEECFRTQIEELRGAIRRMMLIQLIPISTQTETAKEDQALPLYEEKNGLLAPTGVVLSLAAALI